MPTAIRELAGAFPPMSEVRKDPVTGRSVIIAPERDKRPRQRDPRNHLARSELCPFCAGNEALTPPEVWARRDVNTQPNTPGWRVRVVPNKYPALEDCGTWTNRQEGIYESWAGFGVHQVIIESPDHLVNPGMLSEEQFADVLSAYRDRMRDLQRDSRWEYLLLYKNQGNLAGATLEHIHSQLVALPFVPTQAIDELRGAKMHHKLTGSCIYCDVIQPELEHGERLVSASERFVALCPFASRFAYETWILPKNHQAAFVESSEADILALAGALRDVITRLNCALANPPFNYFIHSTPVHETASTHFHWHIEILPQLARAAGFEWGSGSHMNSVAPEDAAGLLRGVAL
jgi:UDPglucose--hexose-1-phosphate uridylyltransferase